MSRKRNVTVAAVQMKCSAHVEENIAKADALVREAAEKVGTLGKLMSGMDPSSGCEMRLLTRMKDGRFAFFTIPERMNALRDYETQGSSTRGDKEQIMAEIFTDWEPAEEPEDELDR